MSEQIEIPTVECMKQAIWSAIKTKTNFARSSGLHGADSQNDNKNTYGPWTDGIMFSENFETTGNPEITSTQYVLSKICTEVPRIYYDEHGEIQGGIDDDFLDRIAIREGEMTDIDGKFINPDSTKTNAKIDTFDVQVFEAHTLGEYLKFIQNHNGKDSRVDTIICKLYGVDDGTVIPDVMGKNGVFYYAPLLRQSVFGSNENSGPTNPENNTILYDLYGPFGLGSDGGIKKNTKDLLNDMYGKGYTTTLKPNENSVKWLSQQSIMENGIVMEDTDYIFYKEIITDSLPEFINSDYFTTDKFGAQIKYKLTKNKTSEYDGTAIGYQNDEPINMKYEPDKEYYPTLTKITIQYTNNYGEIFTEKYQIINP